MKKRQKSIFQDPTNVSNNISNENQKEKIDNKLPNETKSSFGDPQLNNDLPKKEINPKNSLFNDRFLNKQGGSIRRGMNFQNKQTVIIKGEEFEIPDINKTNQRITNPLNLEEEIKKKFISKELNEYWQEQIVGKQKNIKDKIKGNNSNNTDKREENKYLMKNNASENNYKDHASQVNHFYSNSNSLPISYLKVKDLNPNAIQLFNSSYINKLSDLSQNNKNNEILTPPSKEQQNNVNASKEEHHAISKDYNTENSQRKSIEKIHYSNCIKWIDNLNSKKQKDISNENENQNYNKFISISKNKRNNTFLEIQNKIPIMNKLLTPNHIVL